MSWHFRQPRGTLQYEDSELRACGIRAMVTGDQNEADDLNAGTLHLG